MVGSLRMGNPLVSVMVVAHDAERTLGLALSSVLAQTMEDWQCLIVDDGSSTPVSTLVEAMGDARFEFVRLEENRGRGHARQRGLEAARGRLLAVLDADDWMYPDRLEAEVACLRSEPRAKLVGCSMVVEDVGHRIVGVQETAKAENWKLGSVPFSFAPMLVEMTLAREIGFDSRLTRSEDVLFLARALENPWVCVSTPLYAYRPSLATRTSTLESYRCSRMAYARCRPSYPFAARRLELAYRFRQIVHGLCPEPVSQRLTAWSRHRVARAPTETERRAHHRALETVVRLAKSLGMKPT